MNQDFHALKLKDLVIVSMQGKWVNKGRRLLRVNSIKDLHPATGIPYKNFEKGASPDFGNGFFSFDEKDFVVSFGNISTEEFNDQYPEYII